MTNYRSILLLLVISSVFMFGCQPEIQEKYQRPEWLKGKIYSQLIEIDDVSIFASAVKLIGYDTIIDVSGTYTVLAPTDEAFGQWLTENGYGSIDDVPLEILDPLVKYHIVQSPWTKIQLTTLDVYGWIDTLDLTNNKAAGFKRKTILLEDDYRFKVLKEPKQTSIVGSDQSGFPRVGRMDSRKFAPFFYSEYLDIYDLNSRDYEFYFERPWESGDDIYFSNGRITSEQIPAENGFIYTIDRVVEPLKNGYQLLSDNSSGQSYSKFLELVNNFPEFEFNEEETNDQPGAELGLEVDSLFDLSFPELAFDITSEETESPTRILGLPEDVTIRYHNGMMAPTDEAFDQLINDYIDIPFGWGSLDNAPLHIKRIISNAHLSPTAVYPSDMTKGFYNGEKDLIFLDEADVVHAEYGSNCTFVGLSKPIVPRVFSSVTGPIYLQNGFSTTMYAIESSGLLPALKRANKDYMLFFETDNALREDSSLRYDVFRERFTTFQIEGSTFKEFRLNQKDLRNLILNHVGTQRPTGAPRKEFIPNMAGNYLIVNNETGEYSGTAPTTAGFSGVNIAPNFPSKVNANTDNGDAYLIDNWFSFAATSLYNKIQVDFPHFYDLLDQAGLVQKNLYKFNFISESEFYTVLVPTDSAFQADNVNSLSKEELAKLLKLHFIQGELIFTDGRKSSGFYETTRLDEKSNDFSTVFTKIYVESGTDVIRIRASDGSAFTEISESESTNSFAGRLVSDEDDELVISNYVINGVLHEMGKVLSLDEIDRD